MNHIEKRITGNQIAHSLEESAVDKFLLNNPLGLDKEILNLVIDHIISEKK